MSTVGKVVRLATQVARISLGNPKRLSHVMGCALAASEEVAQRELDLLRFPTVTVDDLLPENGKPIMAQLALFPKTHASISVLEFTCLILLMKRTNARSIFEFGTYKGVSITQLAMNLPPDSQIYTLDLPDGQTESALPISDPEDIEIAFENGKGALVPSELKSRIQFLRQDSAQLDEQPYAAQMDFVFVDGAHNLDYVRNDSEKGWRMLRPGGIIAWHDCRVADAAVVRYLLASHYAPQRIAATTLAFAQKPKTDSEVVR